MGIPFNREYRFKCPHCMAVVSERTRRWGYEEDEECTWAIASVICPSCQKIVFYLVGGTPSKNSQQQVTGFTLVSVERMFYPKGSGRPPCPQQVPSELAEDYSEACLVLPDSPKASAALSRRCLQSLLREHANIKHSNLNDEIQEILSYNILPSHLAEAIDAVRAIGNFAAHPIKSQQSGEILPVELGEAEWNLDVIEMLFDFFFVAPSNTQKKRDDLNKKLQEAGKPLMK